MPKARVHLKLTQSDADALKDLGITAGRALVLAIDYFLSLPESTRQDYLDRFDPSDTSNETTAYAAASILPTLKVQSNRSRYASSAIAAWLDRDSTIGDPSDLAIPPQLAIEYAKLTDPHQAIEIALTKYLDNLR